VFGKTYHAHVRQYGKGTEQEAVQRAGCGIVGGIRGSTSRDTAMRGRPTGDKWRHKEQADCSRRQTVNQVPSLGTRRQTNQRCVRHEHR